MGIRKTTKSPYYYAEYRDASGIRRCVSLQTKNMRVARMKYDEIIVSKLHTFGQSLQNKKYYQKGVGAL